MRGTALVEIGPVDFLRALAYARAVKALRPRESLFDLLLGRLGEMIFVESAVRAMPRALVGDLAWVGLPAPLMPPGVDLRINGWKINVRTSSKQFALVWPECRAADLFPNVALDAGALAELHARYKTPSLSRPVGLLADPVPAISGRVAGWIGIGSAEQLVEEGEALATRLASPDTLWALLLAKRGPDIRLAHEAWEKAAPPVQNAQTRKRPQTKPAMLLPPRRRSARAAA